MSVAHVAYLRLVVPFSRLGEMVLEMWAALLDVAVFSLAVVSSMEWKVSESDE